MTSIGLRPALLFFSLTGVNTAASISARKLSNGPTRAIISSGSPFAESPQAACQHRRIQIAPSSPHSRILLSQVRLAQIRGGRYFSRCPTRVFASSPIEAIQLFPTKFQNQGPSWESWVSDEQKARFNAVGPEGQPATDAARSTMQEECRVQVEKIAELPTARIAEAVRPTPEQQAAIDDLNAASMAASDLLKMNCSEDQVLTPPGRLRAMAQRLGAILQAVKTVQPALERFYSMLSDEQKIG